jgi:flagellar hook-length control protein FliK
MTIAIVSTLPKSAPPPAMNASAGMESASPEQGFTSLLLGQLSAVQPGAGSIQFPASDSGNWSLGDENAAAGDPLDFLATLTQASLEQRGNVALAESETPSTGLTGKAAATDERIRTVDRMTQETLQAKLSPASESAAKFAALAHTMSGENASTRQESSELPSAAVVTTGVPARREDTSPAIPIPTALHDRGWNNDFAQKVTWVATQHKQFAELTLNPPAMGSIEISIKLDNDKSTAVATFVSSNADVRETIETALPRLREMLAGVGIALGQTQVSAESFRQTPGNEQNPQGDASQSGNDMAILASDSPTDRTVASMIGAGRGLVDMFV